MVELCFEKWNCMKQTNKMETRTKLKENEGGKHEVKLKTNMMKKKIKNRQTGERRIKRGGKNENNRNRKRRVSLTTALVKDLAALSTTSSAWSELQKNSPQHLCAGAGPRVSSTQSTNVHNVTSASLSAPDWDSAQCATVSQRKSFRSTP